MFRQHAQRRPRGGASEQTDGEDGELDDRGPYGTCSTFYTNNPLLYVSHYSPISGADDTFDNDVTNGASLSTMVMSQTSSYFPPVSDFEPDPLVNRRQVVEMLSLERPFLDYLLQNGVLDKKHVDAVNENIRSGTIRHQQPQYPTIMTSARSNLIVLRCVDSAGHQGFELLLNALRFTGQYILANMLDRGHRIEPQICHADLQHFFGKVRRKGQVRVELHVSSVRLFNSVDVGSDADHSASSEHSSNWISLDELDRRLQLLTSRKPDAVRRGQVTRHRRPVQLVPSSALGATPTTEPVDRSKANSVDLVGRKQQLLGRLVTWMSGGLQRGRYSRNITDSDSSKVPQQVAQENNSVAKSQRSPTSERLTVTDERDVRSHDALHRSTRGEFNLNSSTSGYFRLHRRDITRTSVPSQPPSTSGVTDDVSRTVRQRHSIDKLRRVADCVRVASQEFYSALTGNTMFGDVSRSRERLLRYLESERKVLVLDTSVIEVPDSTRLISSTTSITSCLSVVVICPTEKHLNSLRRDCGVGQLRDDLERRLLTADLIDELNAEIDAVRLEVQLNVDDMELAQSEFQWAR